MMIKFENLVLEGENYHRVILLVTTPGAQALDHRVFGFFGC
jgi:hypothetical protein